MSGEVRGEQRDVRVDAAAVEHARRASHLEQRELGRCKDDDVELVVLGAVGGHQAVDVGAAEFGRRGGTGPSNTAARLGASGVTPTI